MKFRPRLAVLCTALAVVLVGAGCGSDDSGDSASSGGSGKGDLAPVRLAISSWPGFGAMFVAEEKGYYKDLGLSVELDLVEDQTNRVQSIQAGQKDGAGMTTDVWVRWAAQNLDAAQVYITDASAGGDGIVSKKSIATPADLKGKEVGVSKGSTAEFLLGYVLDQAGLKLSDVKEVDMSPADAGAAFAAGKIDVAATWEPWLSKAEESKDGHILASTKDYPVVLTTVALLRSFIEKNPESVQAFVDGTDKAIQFMRDNPAEAAAIIGKKVGLKPDEVEASFETLELYGKAENAEAFKPGGAMEETWNAAAKIWLDSGNIKESPDAANGINGTFVGAGG